MELFANEIRQIYEKRVHVTLEPDPHGPIQDLSPTSNPLRVRNGSVDEDHGSRRSVGIGPTNTITYVTLERIARCEWIRR